MNKALWIVDVQNDFMEGGPVAKETLSLFDPLNRALPNVRIPITKKWFATL